MTHPPRILSALALATSIGMTGACTDPSEPTRTIDTASIDRQLERMVDDGVITGAGVAVIVDGAIVHDHSVGEARDRWQAGSISKPVSAFAALTLVEQGVLDLDASLDDAVQQPYLPPQTAPDHVEAVTLRTVLAHTSGLPNDPLGADRVLRHPPGTAFLYSGGGFSYLQQAIQEQIGQPFDDYMEQEILPTLGMHSSTFSFDFMGQEVVLAAASMSSTPADVARFFMEVARPSADHRAVVEMLVKPEVEVTASLDWGRGIGIYERDDDPRRYWHWGSNLGEHHSLGVIEADGSAGVVVMVVGREDALESIGQIVDAALEGAQYEYWDDVVAGE